MDKRKTKISRIDRLPKFLTRGFLLARLARQIQQINSEQFSMNSTVKVPGIRSHL